MLLTTKIKAIGPVSPSGVANAFHIHSRALATFFEVDVVDLGATHNYTAEQIYFHGAPGAAERISSAAESIAYWVCESSELSDYYHQEHSKFDSLWTASTFCQEVLERELNREVKVVPHCALHYRYFIPQNEIPVILITFDGNSRFMRKNPIAAIKAVKAAFGSACRVVIKAKNLKVSYRRWLLKAGEGLNITIYDQHLSDSALVALYKNADILLSTHRSEGFGLHLLEAMASGTKVVATNWGGCKDFFTDKTGFPIEAVEVATCDRFFPGTWGEPVFDSIVEQLRAAAKDTSVVDAAFNKATEFSFFNTIKKTREAL